MKTDKSSIDKTEGNGDEWESLDESLDLLESSKSIFLLFIIHRTHFDYHEMMCYDSSHPLPTHTNCFSNHMVIVKTKYKHNSRQWHHFINNEWKPRSLIYYTLLCCELLMDSSNVVVNATWWLVEYVYRVSIFTSFR